MIFSTLPAKFFDSNEYQQAKEELNKEINKYKVNIDRSVFKKTPAEKAELKHRKGLHNEILKAKYGLRWKKHIN